MQLTAALDAHSLSAASRLHSFPVAGETLVFPLPHFVQHLTLRQTTCSDPAWYRLSVSGAMSWTANQQGTVAIRASFQCERKLNRSVLARVGQSVSVSKKRLPGCAKWIRFCLRIHETLSSSSVASQWESTQGATVAQQSQGAKGRCVMCTRASEPQRDLIAHP